ncbi:MAG: serine kinase [Sphingomonas sp.]|nr:serine kinase [Sphingomonas sp.]
MNDYTLFGWRVQSALPLPELRPWRGDDRLPDLTIAVGAVPPVDPTLPAQTPGVQVQSQGLRVAIPQVADYLIAAGRHVTIAPLMPRDAPLIRVFLLGTVLALICFQRGLVPLHASAVDIGGRALLISGASGAGKSTLAAAFSAQGYRLLGDDLCALQLDEGQPLRILSAFPRVKLWDDTARQLRVSTDDLDRSREGLEKFNLPLPETRFQPDALPPGQIVFLKTERDGQLAAPHPLVGVTAMRRHDLVHRWKLAAALGYQPLIFKAMARLADRVPMVEVSRSEDLADLPALVDRIRALAERPVSDSPARSSE